MTLHALILAGGRGSRLGDVRKARLRVGGIPLLDRVVRRLHDLPVLLATGPGSTPGFNIGVEIPDDSSSYAGPMAGISAALRHLGPDTGPDDLLLTLAVDTPFLPEDYATRMIAALTSGADAAFAIWGGELYPTNAIYRLCPALQKIHETRPHSPKALLRSLEAVEVDWTDDAGENPFANLNTLTDLLALGRRAIATGK
ncbi:MAG: hypothetical protein ABS75_01800 [Pelagibacterium sp. SCN 63-23]|nr:MAG: hypothetical protein ABS75_01800 [Pelagibacterium sp. SCN 63-23]